MAPLRTIAGAFFNYVREDGSRASAQRGETVDIPEGEDLERGDKFGAFTPEVDEEPAPPVGTELVRPQLDWSDSEFDRYTDAAHADELQSQFEVVHPIDQPVLAAKMLASEQRKANPREAVVTYLEGKLGVAPPAEGSTEMPDGTVLPPGEVVTAAGVPVDTTAIPNPLTTDETTTTEGLPTLADFVNSNIDVVLERVGDDKALAQQVLDIEVVGKNRKTLVDQLKAVIEA